MRECMCVRRNVAVRWNGDYMTTSEWGEPSRARRLINTRDAIERELGRVILGVEDYGGKNWID